MTSTPPPAAPPPGAGADAGPGTAPGPQGGPRVSPADMRALGRLRRSLADRKVAGVAGGLGRHLDVDPTIVRVAFVILVLFGGAGILLYAACWLLVPEDGRDRATVDVDAGARTVILAVVGALAVTTMVGHSWGLFGFPWPLTVLGVVALVVIAGGGFRTRRSTAAPDGWTPPPTYGPEGPTVSLDKTAPYSSAPYSSAPGWVGAPTSDKPTSDAPTSEAPTTYAPTAYAPPSYGPPPGSGYDVRYGYVPPPPPSPRRRGPRLFLPTLFLVAIALGLLRVVDLGGADVPGPAYAALAVAVCGAVLVMGAWFGRAGGVVLLGLLSVLALLASLVAANGVGEVDESPTTAAAVSDSYDIGIGKVALSLQRVGDLEALDGRVLHLEADFGQIVVDVPAGLAVTATAEAHGGQVDVFGQTDDGDRPAVTRELAAAAGAPHLTIEASLDFGQITVRRV